MEICLLCNEEHRKENLLSKELGNDFTIEDGIKQYFVTHRVSVKTYKHLIF